MTEKQEVKNGHLTFFERKVRAAGFFIGVTATSGVYGMALGAVAQGEFPDAQSNLEITANYEQAREKYPPAELPTGKIGLVIGAAVGVEVARRVK